jgi:hypothetical protein
MFRLGAVGNIDGINGLDLVVLNPASKKMEVSFHSTSFVWSTLGGYLPGSESSFVCAQPVAAAIGDLDHDGHGDIAVVCQDTSTVNVQLARLNQATHFTPLPSVPVASVPSAIALGDINGDGFLDAAVSSFATNKVSVLLNKADGSGAFLPANDYLTGTSPTAVALADMDGDGHLDAVTADAASNTVTILLGGGGGTFPKPGTSAIHLAVGSQPAALVVADLTGDGMPDIATANAGDGTVSVLVKQVGTTFQPAHTYSVGGQPRSLVAGHFNCDSLLDLAVGNAATGKVTTLLNIGSPLLFARASEIDLGSGNAQVSLGVGNFNDGADDLVVVRDRTSLADTVSFVGDNRANGINYDGILPASSYPVLPSPRVYLIWYGDWSYDRVGQEHVRAFVRGLASSRYFSIIKTYSPACIPSLKITGLSLASQEVTLLPSQLSGLGATTAVDSTAVSSQIIPAALQQLPTEQNAIYLVMPSRDIADSQPSPNHSFAALPSGTMVPFIWTKNHVLPAMTSPFNNSEVSGMSSSLPHEIAETITDPFLSGWHLPYDINTELADLCQGAPPSQSRQYTTFNGVTASTPIGGDDWFPPSLWANDYGILSDSYQNTLLHCTESYP